MNEIFIEWKCHEGRNQAVLLNPQFLMIDQVHDTYHALNKCFSNGDMEINFKNIFNFILYFYTYFYKSTD